jgi:hypothetical protein
MKAVIPAARIFSNGDRAQKQAIICLPETFLRSR